MDIEQKL
jgi:hypothetical protein